MRRSTHYDGGIITFYNSIALNPIVHKFIEISVFVISVYFEKTALIRKAIVTTRFCFYIFGMKKGMIYISAIPLIVFDILPFIVIIWIK